MSREARGGGARRAALAARARELGFHRLGVAPAAVPPEHAAAFERWLAEGMAGGMTPWMERDRAARLDPTRVLPGARSVVCVLVDHRQLEEWYPDGAGEAAGAAGRVARYARARDYHIPMRKRLKCLAQFLEEAIPGAQTRVCVDIEPVLERALAWRAGLGFLGRNTMLITPGVGSYTLLGEVVTDVELPPDEPGEGTCGSCTRCLEACPTGAFPAPYRLDARRCISAWTIEHRGPLPEEAELHGWALGCDRCQEVCPYNRPGTPLPLGDDFRSPRAPGAAIAADELEALADDAAFRRRYTGTVAMRPGREGIERNLARIAEEADGGGCVSSRRPGSPAPGRGP